MLALELQPPAGEDAEAGIEGLEFSSMHYDMTKD